MKKTPVLYVLSVVYFSLALCACSSSKIQEDGTAKAEAIQKEKQQARNRADDAFDSLNTQTKK